MRQLTVESLSDILYNKIVMDSHGTNLVTFFFQYCNTKLLPICVFFPFVLCQVCRRAYPAYWSGHWNSRFQLCYKWAQEGISHSESCCTEITIDNWCNCKKPIRCSICIPYQSPMHEYGFNKLLFFPREMQLFICIHTSSLCKNLKVRTFFILSQKPSLPGPLC